MAVRALVVMVTALPGTVGLTWLSDRGRPGRFSSSPPSRSLTPLALVLSDRLRPLPSLSPSPPVCVLSRFSLASLLPADALSFDAASSSSPSPVPRPVVSLPLRSSPSSPSFPLPRRLLLYVSARRRSRSARHSLRLSAIAPPFRSPYSFSSSSFSATTGTPPHSLFPPPPLLFSFSDILPP